jgi:hypothetical protein
MARISKDFESFLPFPFPANTICSRDDIQLPRQEPAGGAMSAERESGAA